MNARILIVEDEAPVLRGLEILLRAKGFEVLSATSGPEGLIKAGAAHPDLILLDVMLPGMSGFDVLRALRAEKLKTPVVMLTAKATEVDKVLGFELGVDDYVTKPFSTLELLGRIQAVLRRSLPEPADAAPGEFGAVRIDWERLEMRRGEDLVELPPRALELLRVLAQADGRVVSRDQLIDALWGEDQIANHRSIDNLVVKVRQAIEPEPGTPRHLLTVHGRGYRLVR